MLFVQYDIEYKCILFDIASWYSVLYILCYPVLNILYSKNAENEIDFCLMIWKLKSILNEENFHALGMEIENDEVKILHVELFLFCSPCCSLLNEFWRRVFMIVIRKGWEDILVGLSQPQFSNIWMKIHHSTIFIYDVFLSF